MKNAYASFDLSNPKCIRVVYSAKEPTKQELEEFLAFSTKILLEYKNFVIVSDVSKMKYLASEHRIKLGNWLKKHDTLIKERCLGTVYVVSSSIGRIILNGVFLVNKPLIPRVIVPSMAEAEDWARKRLEDIA